MKKIIINIIENIKHFLLFNFNVFRNKYIYKLWNITKIEYEIRQLFLKTIKIKWYYEPYQSYPPLNIKWQRPTWSRIWNYWILNFADKKSDVLDIWWNVWFLSMYLSKFVKNVDIIEFDEWAVKIWEKLKENEKIKNVAFYNLDFKKFETEKKYNIVMSYAVHWWVWMEINSYLQKIYDLLENNWILIIESHYIYVWKKWKDDKDLKNQILAFNKFEIIKEWISDDDKNWVLRNFYVCKKI